MLVDIANFSHYGHYTTAAFNFRQNFFRNVWQKKANELATGRWKGQTVCLYVLTVGAGLWQNSRSMKFNSARFAKSHKACVTMTSVDLRSRQQHVDSRSLGVQRYNRTSLAVSCSFRRNNWHLWSSRHYLTILLTSKTQRTLSNAIRRLTRSQHVARAANT